MYRKLVSLIIFFIAGIIFAGQASALSLDYSSVSVLGGTRYDFELSSLVTDPEIFELFLNLPVDITNISDTNAPFGWGSASDDPLDIGTIMTMDNGDGTSSIDWEASSGGTNNLFPGNSLSGFSFVSTSLITGNITFAKNFEAGVSGSATSSAPISSVPEPSTIILLGTGIMGILIRRKLAYNLFLR